MQKRTFKKVFVKFFLAVSCSVLLIAFWYILYIAVGNNLKVPSPADTWEAFVSLGTDPSSYKTIVAFLLRIAAGWVIGCLLGFMTAFAEADTRLQKTLKALRSFGTALPAVPLYLIFAGVFFRVPFLFVMCAALIAGAFSMWKAVQKGHNSLDSRLLLMARCNASFWDVLRYLRLPYLVPFISRGLVSAWSSAFGMGLLAEFIGSCNGSVGERLTAASESLLSDELFAWCILLCLLAVISRWLISWVAGRIRYFPRLEATANFARNGRSFPLVFDRISKTVGKEKCLDKFSYAFSNGKVTAVCGGTAVARTALLMVAAFVEKDDDGRYVFPPTAPALIFEDPCLIPNLTVRENILFANRAANIVKILKALSLVKEADKFPADLDLPTRKRVAIARAIAFGGGIGVFCEPFKGMDDDTKALSAAALFGAYRGKTVLFATENTEDAEKFGNEVLNLK